MPLPEILVPAAVPPYRAQNHARKRSSLHRDVPMGTGHGRKRPKTTAAPTIVDVSVRMSAAAMVAHDAWYENTLRVGTRAFAARLFGFGTSTPQWWEATWEAPYSADPVAGGFWVVTGKLRLKGGGSDAGPVSTSAAVEFSAAFIASGSAAISTDAAVEFSAAFTVAQRAAIEFSAAFEGVTPSFFDLEDMSGVIELETGGQLQGE